jgi:lambda family phage tail tape measure protein
MAKNELNLKLSVEGGKIVIQEIDGVNKSLGGLNTGARNAAGGADVLKGALGSLATIGTALALVKMADSVTSLRTALNLASGSAAEAGKAYDALFDIAQRGRVSFTELGSTYAAVARNGRELGISQDRLLAVTQSISQAMTIGGGSASSMQAALVQLGQGLSSGVLRGEELNSVMEQTPRLAKAIADGLGVPIGKLREMGQAGEITSQKLIMALEKAGPQLAKEMESATLTVGQAFTLLTNSAVKFTGDADTATGATHSLASAMQSLSGGIDTVGSTIKNNQTAFAVITGGLAGAVTLAGVAALAANIGKVTLAVRGLTLAMAANPFMALGIGLATVAGAVYTAGEANKHSLSSMKATLKELETMGTRGGMYGTAASQQVLDKRAADIVRLRQEISVMEAASSTASDSYNAKEMALLTGKENAFKKLAADRASFAKAGEAFATKDQKNQAILNAAIESAGELLARGSITATEYATRINAVQASFAGVKKAAAQGVSEAAKGLALYNDLMAKDSGLAANFEEQWASLKKAKLGTEQFAAAQAVLLSQQPYMVKAAADQARADQDAAHAKEEDFQALLRQIDVYDKARTAVQAYKAAQSAEVSGMGLGQAGRDKAAGVSQREKQFADQPELLAQSLKDWDAHLAAKSAAQASWQLGAKDSMADYLSTVGNVYQSASALATKAFKGMEDALVSFVTTGKLDFASLASSIISDLVRIQIQQSITGPMAAAMNGGGGLFSLFSANGNTFDAGGVQAFANGGAFTNQVVSRPTPFKFASGGGFKAGLMGEAGPEAIMPLRRGPGGALGVQAFSAGPAQAGTSNSVVVNIIEAPGQGGTQSRRTENGVDILDVFVEKVKSAIAVDISRGAGAVPAAMNQTYGLNRVAGAY